VFAWTMPSHTPRGHYKGLQGVQDVHLTTQM